MSLTANQQAAVLARGNVLVMAGAGTGKTSTLVERCLHCLLEEQPPASLDEILMVTFTEAAAADMRRRIRKRLEFEADSRESSPENVPLLEHLREQLGRFETAHIGTLHSFCFQLVRQHFYELGLDPQMTVLAEEEARLLAEETLDAILQRHYAGGNPASKGVQELIEVHGGGRDQPIRALVLRLYHYTQTRPDPEVWFADQIEGFSAPKPVAWENWFSEALAAWRQQWLPVLEKFARANDLARECVEAVKSIPQPPAARQRILKSFAADRAAVAPFFQRILSARDNCPRGKKKAWRDPLERFFDEAEFFASLATKKETATASADTSPAPSADPLSEDWDWVRTQMKTLLELAREFQQNFAESKRELGVVDFHDLEQHSLRLLLDPQTNAPSRIARQWRKQFRFVFVDEYQDINAAQDKIIQALSRDLPHANRFLVGDVKQSIYRFRLADPSIFQRYAQTWQPGDTSTSGAQPEGQVVPLNENFRSRERILNFVNSFFSLVMRRETGGVEYDDDARLRFGAPEPRQPLSAAADPGPSVELFVRFKRSASAPDAGSGMDDLGDLEEADKEARAIALQLRELKTRGQPVWDEESKSFRPVEWRDMAILMRSPANKSERYAKEFARLNIPLQAARGGFYDSFEISDLLSLMRVLDNPLQDVPLLAILHSPLVGLTLDELAIVRLAAKGPYWTALARWNDGQSSDPETKRLAPELPAKVTRFLDRFSHWRRLARQASLSQCLETILTETHYVEWLQSQRGGEQARANIQRLLLLARQFDQFQRKGLFRFLRFVEAQQKTDSEPDVAPVIEENSVRLMSIHQSKGLEFPVVAVADLGKSFNVSDLRADVILDENYGLCPQIMPPHIGTRYPSLPHWLASRRQHREMLGEELRLFYVAATRARDLLLLSASITESRFDKIWQPKDDAPEPALFVPGRYADWLGTWFAQNRDALDGPNPPLKWKILNDEDLAASVESSTDSTPKPDLASDPAVLRELIKRLEWQYPFSAATRQPAKIRVSDFARRAAELDEEAADWQIGSSQRSQPSSPDAETAAAIGSAHHTFLELVSLDSVDTLDQLRAESRRLEKSAALKADDLATLDLEGMAAFWASDIGTKMRSHATNVRRELAFTVRFAPAELDALTGLEMDRELHGEEIIAEGKADLVLILPDEIILVDFKTDRVSAIEVSLRAKSYEPQLRLYARALSEIYRRPVTERWLYFLTARKAVQV